MSPLPGRKHCTLPGVRGANLVGEQCRDRGCPPCQNCYDERYTSCCDCGTLLRITNATGEWMYIKRDGSLDDGS